MDALQDLQHILDVEIHVGMVDTTKKDEENSKQTSKVRTQVCQWMYLSLVLQVHATLVVYYPLDGDACQLIHYH